MYGTNRIPMALTKLRGVVKRARGIRQLYVYV
jgi:hypothetical protein